MSRDLGKLVEDTTRAILDGAGMRLHRTLIVTPGAEGYEEIRTLECSCGHVSVRDPDDMAERRWVHACPGCDYEHTVEPWQ